MNRILLAMTMAISVSACSYHAQDSSGEDYLYRYASDAGSSEAFKGKTVPDLASAIREASSVEPILNFPARIGLARIEDRRLTNIPTNESLRWKKLSEKYVAMGQFVPVDPVTAYYTQHSIRLASNERYSSGIGKLVETIRLGAARQHLDAVLIYYINAEAQRRNNTLAVADLTIIGGAVLPTRSIKAQGEASVLLLDVRNGYPYGSASTSIDLSGFSTSWGADGRKDKLRLRALDRVNRELMPEVDAMLSELLARMRKRQS